MLNALGLLRKRRFLPLFVTQFLGAFNDNLFKQAIVLFATYQIFSDAQAEQNFNALATAIGIIPFFVLSALSGQLADTSDKARIIRIVKTAEIGIMIFGAAGVFVAQAGWINLGLAMMLGAVLLLREIAVSGLREFLAGLQVSLPVSKLAKWKTTLQLVAFGALILAGAVPDISWVRAVGLACLWGAAVLTLVTGWDYLRVGLKHMDS